MTEILVAGGGIGGLAAALACALAACQVQLFERAGVFSEVGAGIQLGPNAVRVLDPEGHARPLAAGAANPERLLVRDAGDGRVLSQLRLGAAMRERYGQPYATVHRADLHALLLHAVREDGRVALALDSEVSSFESDALQVRLKTAQGRQVQGDALIGCDGIGSRVRQQMLRDGPPREPGHLAYRAMLPQAELPSALRSNEVTVWLGPRLHVVQYPVRGGEWLNVVAIVEGRIEGDVQDWDQGASAADLQRAMLGSHCALLSLIEAIAHWRLWVLRDRPPLPTAASYVAGRVALLGDAAHPMRPYMAQGAAMAMEDAHALGLVLAQQPQDLPAALQGYAALRWQRNTQVQQRAQRNGEIFHASGPLRLGRDLVMGVLGERLLDVPWLYRGPQYAG
jgi:salicylate hydroxylase